MAIPTNRLEAAERTHEKKWKEREGRRETERGDRREATSYDYAARIGLVEVNTSQLQGR